LPVLQEVVITIDEFEALRLADLEGLYQEDAAHRMGVSRQTFGNIIMSARRKVAGAIVNARVLKIEGGAVEMTGGHFVCCRCRNEWLRRHGTGTSARCPRCKSADIERTSESTGKTICAGPAEKTNVCRRTNR
jgi:predicted DNA-binding protein (UPF0251 family)